MQKTVLITGASSGIGYELCKRFAQNNHNIVLVARNKEKLDTIAKELSSTHDIQTHVFTHDLTDDDAPQKLYAEIKENNITIDILVNNAGFGLYGKFTETNLAKELDMIKINISALTELTKLFLPDMISKKSGKVLNIASTAAFQPGPGMAVYYASKAFVLHFSEALGEELKNTGVSVTTLCPGPTRTGFEKAAELRFPKTMKVMNADEVAYVGYRGLIKNKRVVIPGFRNKLLAFANRLAPRNVATKITGWIQNN
ncbi:short-chain dehydrogenase [Candidatus Parcubacteria bacterium]|nr:MAG: short-chain dehydrogenase [Candidatus Parcubacteria bacterium]